jgi:hypothetical protein
LPCNGLKVFIPRSVFEIIGKAKFCISDNLVLQWSWKVCQQRICDHMDVVTVLIIFPFRYYPIPEIFQGHLF